MKSISYLKIITIVNLLVATGYSVAGIINPHLILTAGTPAEKSIEIFALYAAARTVPLALITICSIYYKNFGPLVILAFLAGTIQLLDSFIGVYQHDLSKTLGPLIIALAEFLAIYLTKKNWYTSLKI